MATPQFTFDHNQLNRLFPYFISINKDMTVNGYGPELNKIGPFAAQNHFFNLFKIVGHENALPGEIDLEKLVGTKITLSLVSLPRLLLQGNLEYTASSEAYLFLCAEGRLTDDVSQKGLEKKGEAVSEGILYTNDFYQRVLDAVPADIVVFDTNHVYRYLNPKAIKDPELRKWMIGKTDEDYCMARNRPMSLAAERRESFNEVMRTKRLKSWEEKLINQDGSACYLLRNMHPVLNAQSEVEFVIGYGIDITERKHMEEQLAINEKRYHDLYEYSPALIYTHDTEGIMLSVNPAICTVLGYSREEIIHKSIKILLPPADRGRMESEYLNKVNTEGVSKGIFRVSSKNGETQYLLYQNYRVEEEGIKPYIIGFSQDITDRIKAEKELLLAKHTTENVARAKETFLANMSHEIRTPINGILGVTNLLIKTRLDEKQKNYANLISKSVNNLLNIINDILDLEKIGSGKIEFENHPFKVVDKVWSTIQLFQYQAEQRNLKLLFKNNLPANLVTIGDQYRLAQILSNMLSNAIKFTHVGSITVNLSLLHYSDTDVIIEFLVQDTGIGISENRLSVIFDPFVQAASNTTREFGGTGLGLSICKSLIEMQGGSISLTSEIGQGTTFTFNIPYKRGLVHMIPEEHNDNQNFGRIEKKILVAEDIELNQFLVKTMLESWGSEVDIASNGVQALQMIKENYYDLVLMDIQMPEMDGMTVTRHIRELADPQKRDIGIIAFTANALKGDSIQYLEAGMNDYISKPYTEEKLYKKIIKLLKAKGQLNQLSINKNIGNRVEIPMENMDAEEINKPTITAGQPRLYNTSTIESISKDNPAFLEKMIVMFVDIVGKDFAILKSAAERNDWYEVGQVAHKLKSTMGNMGVTTLMPLATALEAETGDKQENVRKLEGGLTEVTDQLRADYHYIFV